MNRERNIVSNLYQTTAGTWKLRWRQHGRNKQRTFRRKSDALELQAELFNGTKTPNLQKTLLFEDFCKIWVRRHCEVNVEQSTAKDYISKLNANVLPYFKGIPLGSVDEDDVIKFKEWLTLEKKLSPVTVGNHIRMLRLIFNCACRWKDEGKKHYLYTNPVRHVKEPKKPEPDFRFWTEVQIRRFLELTVREAPIVYTVALVAVATGMRRGEIYALLRDCLDFENRLITVKRAFSFPAREFKHTKAKRIRRIPMNEEVYRALLSYREKEPNHRIFEGVDIEHFHKILRNWCLKADVPIVGLHDLRDTFASSLVRAGVKIKVIQKLMGHVDITVTEKYMHLDPNDLSGSTDLLLTGVSPTPPLCTQESEAAGALPNLRRVNLDT